MKTFIGALLMLTATIGGAAVLAGQGSEPQATPGTADGDRLFHEKGCAYCHGPGALGTDKAPSLEQVGIKRSKEQIVRQIREGGPAMPAFGESLEPAEIDNLAAYLVLKRGLPPARTGKGR